MASRDADICCWRQQVVFLSSPLRGVSLNYEGSLWPASGCGSLWWGRGASPPSAPAMSLLLEGFSSSSALWYSCWPSEKSPGSFRTFLSLGQIIKCIFEALRTCMEKSASEAGSPPLLKEAAGACVNIPGVAWKFPERVRGHCCAHVHHLAGWSQRWSAFPLAAGLRHLSAFWEMPRGTPFLRLQTLSCSDLPRHLKFHSGDSLVGSISCSMSVHCWVCQRTHQTMAVINSSVLNSASCSSQSLKTWGTGYVRFDGEQVRSGPGQGSAHYGMQAKSGRVPVWEIVLLAPRHASSSCLCCIHATMAELSGCNRDHKTCKE